MITAGVRKHHADIEVLVAIKLDDKTDFYAATVSEMGPIEYWVRDLEPSWTTAQV